MKPAIDVHHHFAPRSYLNALGEAHAPHPAMRGWSLEQSLDDMDRSGVQKAILSITVPGVWFGDDAAARSLSRLCNEEAAAIIAGNGNRFGFFATLPLPDIDGALTEIPYALDELGADGIQLYTSYGDWRLGHPALAPVLEELNRRGSIVHVHPTCPACCAGLLSDVPDAIIEYGTDTARTITDFVFSGVSSRYPALRMIFSHAGGTMPALSGRLDDLGTVPRIAARLPHGHRHELGRFYYDTAQAANPRALRPLLDLTDVSHVLFGTDFPYRTTAVHIDGLAACGFTNAELRAIERDNVARLFSAPEPARSSQ